MAPNPFELAGKLIAFMSTSSFTHIRFIAGNTSPNEQTKNTYPAAAITYLSKWTALSATEKERTTLEATKQCETVLAFLGNPQLINTEGQTVFSIAAEKNHPEIIKALMDDPRINVNQCCRLGMTPLNYAAQNGCLAIVEILLKHFAITVNAPDKKGYAPLHNAVLREHTEIVARLVAHHLIVIDAKTVAKETAMDIAIKWKLTRIQAILNKKPDDVNTTTQSTARTCIIAFKPDTGSSSAGINNNAMVIDDSDNDSKVVKRTMTVNTIMPSSGS